MIDEAIEEECGDFILVDVIPTIQFEVIAPPTISSLITGILNLRLKSNMDPLLVFCFANKTRFIHHVYSSEYAYYMLGQHIFRPTKLLVLLSDG